MYAANSVSCELEHSVSLAIVSFFWEYSEKAVPYCQASIYCKEWIFKKSLLSWLGQLDNSWKEFYQNVEML